MGIEAGWRTLLAIEALTAFADGMAFFVPAKAGAQEGGIVLAFALAGLPPACSGGALQRPGEQDEGLRADRWPFRRSGVVEEVR